MIPPRRHGRASRQDKGIGRVNPRALVDTHGSHALGFLHLARQPEAAVAVLHNDMPPFHEKLDLAVGDAQQAVRQLQRRSEPFSWPQFPAEGATQRRIERIEPPAQGFSFSLQKIDNAGQAVRAQSVGECADAERGHDVAT